MNLQETVKAMLDNDWNIFECDDPKILKTALSDAYIENENLKQSIRGILHARQN